MEEAAPLWFVRAAPARTHARTAGMRFTTAHRSDAAAPPPSPPATAATCACALTRAQVYSTAAQEGGIHMSSIGPALESQLDKVPLREGADDMVGALAYRGIPITVVW
jgi:hypothetical protein